MNVTIKSETDRGALTFAMNLSLNIGLLMLFMKMGTYLLTGSAVIPNDAAESEVHVPAVMSAAYRIGGAVSAGARGVLFCPAN